MRDVDFLAELLRIDLPWKVVESILDRQRGRVDVQIESQGPGICPKCGHERPKHDHRERVWRDLDLCADQLYLHALVPRVSCPEHGVITVSVPWSVGRTEFTSRLERLVIALLSEMSIAAVARRLGVSWDQIDAVMTHAVERGLERREARIVRHIGIDEKAVKKRHKYFTIVSDLERGLVLWIGRGRKRECLDGFWKTLSAQQLEGIEGVAMDMWQPYIDSTLQHVPGASRKIVFDKFHITMYLTKAVDLTRRALRRDATIDQRELKGTKYLWLRNPAGMALAERRELTQLRRRYHKLGRAWAIKEQFVEFWGYRRESAARRFFAQWYHWATHSQLAPVISAARTVKRHLENILTYLHTPITNAAAEGINSKIQMVKYRARGYRNEGRFARAILFHCGGLDLYPTHPNS